MGLGINAKGLYDPEGANTTLKSVQRRFSLLNQSGSPEKKETIHSSTSIYGSTSWMASAINSSKTKALTFFSKKIFRNKFRHSHRGLSPVSTVFMLLLMLTAIIGLTIAFSNYNSSIEKQTQTQNERSREQIVITQIATSSQQKITNITISNTGAIEVTIRALYREDNGTTVFLTDPSAHIAQSSSKTINITNLGLTVNSDSLLIAATEQGIKSKGVNEMELLYGKPPDSIDTSGLTIGPLLLTFDSLNWAPANQNGNLKGDWQQTYTIPTGYCAWRLNLTNVDTEKRSLTINQYSGFTTSLISSPVATTWYLQASQYTIDWNQTMPVYFLWDSSRSTATNANSNQKGFNNIFLTVFGNYSDGETFAQTIPFEAITIG